MGFNFGAFAGGLADGIEKGEKIRAAAEERKRKEKEATTKAQKEARETQEAKDKVLREQDEKLKKAFSEANKNMTDYIVDGDIDAGIKYFNTESDTYNLGTKKAKLTSGGETYIVDVPSGQEETISAIQADLDKYNGNGHYKVDKLGNVLTRQYDTQEFQPSQIKGTNTALYGKPEAEKPTAHTTQVVSSLPEAQQKILEQKGYKPTDEVSNTVIAKLATEKPTKQTVGDIKARQYEEYQSAGGELTYDAWAEKNKTLGAMATKAGAITAVAKFGKDLTAQTYDYDSALTIEANYIASPAYSDTDKKDKANFNEQVKLEQDLSDLEIMLEEEFKSGRWKAGFTATVQKTALQYVEGDKWKNMMGWSSEEFQTTLGVDTAMGDTLVRYVKEISGAAVTDTERKTLMNIMFGGTFQTAEARLTKYKAFVKKIRNKNKISATKLKETHPATAGEYLYGSKKKKKTVVARRVSNGRTIVQYSDGTYGEE